jgi:hypothetical protein
LSSGQVAYAQKRRSTRIDRAVPVAVQGLGAYREPYQEQVSTQSISCHGCAYQSKYEVIQGEVVYLDVRSFNDGSSHGSSRARVKWVQNLGNNIGFQVAVELEVAGNIWGIASPPEDWFPARAVVASETAAQGRELRVVSRTEQKAAPEAEPGPISPLEKTDAAGATLSSLAQVMAGLGEQIQVMASEAATTAFAEQKSRLVDEFRLQLRDEAVKSIRSLIMGAKESFTQLAMKELNEAHEAGARANYARWMKKIEQDMEAARQHMMNQTTEVTRRLDTMAASTLEHVQRSVEASRSEAVDRFVSRLREQIAPMFAEAKDTLQALAASETALKKESQDIYARLENEIANSASTSLAKVHEDLGKSTADITAQTTETFLKLSYDFEKAGREHLQSLVVSMGNHMTKTLEQRTAELSREFAAGLEGYTRNYLDFISKSIAEIPKNSPPPSHE